MLPVDERERIRRAYYVEHKPKRQIARELGHARTTVDKALSDGAPAEYHLSQPRSAPVLGPVKAQIDAWVVGERDFAAQTALYQSRHLQEIADRVRLHRRRVDHPRVHQPRAPTAPTSGGVLATGIRSRAGCASGLGRGRSRTGW